jgi:hypothetical protein
MLPAINDMTDAPAMTGGNPQWRNPQWYVLQTRPHQELRAEENLSAWRVETLLPKVRRPVRRVRPDAGHLV